MSLFSVRITITVLIERSEKAFIQRRILQYLQSRNIIKSTSSLQEEASKLMKLFLHPLRVCSHSAYRQGEKDTIGEEESK